MRAVLINGWIFDGWAFDRIHASLLALRGFSPSMTSQQLHETDRITKLSIDNSTFLLYDIIRIIITIRK